MYSNITRQLGELLERLNMNPVGKLVAFLTVLLGADTALQGTGLVTGTAAAWITASIAVLTAALGALTHKTVNRSLDRAKAGRL